MSEAPSRINSTTSIVAATAIGILVGLLLYFSLLSQGQANLHVGCISLRTQINSSDGGWAQYQKDYPEDARNIRQTCLTEADPPVDLDA